jgi:protein pelota
LNIKEFSFMQILRKDIKHNTIMVVPEFFDDYWVLYNVIHKGDHVYAKTTRELRLVDRYDRLERGKRISVFLGITVEKIFWDRYLNRLRVHGIIHEAPKKVGLGDHHTLNLKLNRPLTIVKNKWMKYQIDQLKRATERHSPKIIVISIDDEGYCIAILRGFGLDIKLEEKISLPGKYYMSKRTSTIQKLLKSATTALEQIWEDLQAQIVVLGLDYLKKDLIKYLEKKKPEIKNNIIDVKSVNSTGKAGIFEALRSGILNKALTHVRITEEASAVEEVLKRLGKEQPTVTYGLSDVERAYKLGAIDKLLLTDLLLREAADEERQNLERLMREVEKKRGKVIIISTEHEAGIKLKSLGGIAALLRFPLN